MARIMYPIAFKLQALGLLETMTVYQVATELGVARRTLRNWVTKRAQILAYRGNKKHMKLTPGVPSEVLPDPPGLLEFIHGLRDSERALTTIHMVTWVKRNQREWLVSYLVDKRPGCGYNLLLQRFFKRHGISRQRPGISKRSQGDLEDTHDIFAAEFHREYRAHGAESVYNVDETGEKHSMRMTAVLTAKADGSKLPILFVMKGTPGGRIETSEFPTFPAGHSYAVQ
ncbi:hypothetical protein H257_16815 [Aphanomyces astaci]|uniref:HTH psq-type domain-containing protein n=1 Tax=Aphanomyces astaci TaxID=112090 RepID=W4FJ72_APHAT|nr:hypothetical protein H257_16815 [Aphanomyces astaci]ETV66886.1 hypothetical protein H257_16815 [Aphanomyces astaci]|eukprot:XP_009843689.1 hypothetical protein H257_16815 [Aphanomyces astaci]